MGCVRRLSGQLDGRFHLHRRDEQLWCRVLELAEQDDGAVGELPGDEAAGVLFGLVPESAGALILAEYPTVQVHPCAAGRRR